MTLDNNFKILRVVKLVNNFLGNTNVTSVYGQAMATPTPHQSGGPTAASQAGSTPTSVPASSMTQNGFNQNVSPMPNFSFNQMSKVIPSKLTILIGRSNHESSIFYI